MISNSHYVLDLLTDQIHTEDCSAVEEIMPNNRQSLGMQKNSLEAVLKAKNLGYPDAVVECPCNHKEK